MYTGKLISGLMAMVELAERHAQELRVLDEMELRRIFELQISRQDREPVYAGAA